MSVLGVLNATPSYGGANGGCVGCVGAAPDPTEFEDAQPVVSIIDAQERLPWGGHMGHHAVPEVYNIIRQHKTSIVFVNTRAQAELVFDRLWRINEENLAIGLHHGSLAV